MQSDTPVSRGGSLEPLSNPPKRIAHNQVAPLPLDQQIKYLGTPKKASGGGAAPDGPASRLASSSPLPPPPASSSAPFLSQQTASSAPPQPLPSSSAAPLQQGLPSSALNPTPTAVAQQSQRPLPGPSPLSSASPAPPQGVQHQPPPPAGSSNQPAAATPAVSRPPPPQPGSVLHPPLPLQIGQSVVSQAAAGAPAADGAHHTRGGAALPLSPAAAAAATAATASAQAATATFPGSGPAGQPRSAGSGPAGAARQAGAAGVGSPGGPRRQPGQDALGGSMSSSLSRIKSTVDHSAEKEKGISVENFIPFRYPELRKQIMEDHKEVFATQEVKDSFKSFCGWLSLRNKLRLSLIYGDALDKYAPLDPDSDALDPGDDDVRASEMNVDTIRHLHQDFESELHGLLGKGEFQELPKDELVKARSTKSLQGLHVENHHLNRFEWKMWQRGKRDGKFVYKSWRTLWRKRTADIDVYQRLVVMFSLRPEGGDLEAGEDKRQGCLARCLSCFRRKHVKVAGGKLQRGYVYLKLFKDVGTSDIDMLLPGSECKFSWFDWIMIWGPICFGVGMAIYKAATGTIRFDNLMDILTSLVLIVMPLSWGVRAFLAIKDKMREYEAHLNQLFLIHNLNNNAGVLSQLLDEAQEQEDNEAMLAYFFLWRGMQQPAPLSKLDLDKDVEGYLDRLLKKEGLSNVLQDFDVTDAVDKLRRMSIVSLEDGAGPGGLLGLAPGDRGSSLLPLPLGSPAAHNSRLRESLGGADGAVSSLHAIRVESLPRALDLIHVRHFDEEREAREEDTLRKRKARLDVPWYECFGTFPKTGQIMRYFFNASTGQSVYVLPEGVAYVPCNDPQPALPKLPVSRDGGLVLPVAPPVAPHVAASGRPPGAAPAVAGVGAGAVPLPGLLPGSVPEPAPAGAPLAAVAGVPYGAGAAGGAGPGPAPAGVPQVTGAAATVGPGTGQVAGAGAGASAQNAALAPRPPPGPAVTAATGSSSAGAPAMPEAGGAGAAGRPTQAQGTHGAGPPGLPGSGSQAVGSGAAVLPLPPPGLAPVKTSGAGTAAAAASGVRSLPAVPPPPPPAVPAAPPQP